MSQATAVVERTDNAPTNVAPHPATSDSAALMLMAERLATNPDADVSKLKQILDIAREARRDEAEAAFNDAMTAAQVEMGRVKANKDNKQTKSKYADYAKLDQVLRPIYTKHGFALSFDTESAQNGVVVVAHVSRSGFSRDYKIPMPTDGKGPQGGDVMTKTHATGAAMTYGMRYLLKMIFNVAIGEDDNDGNTVSPTISEDQIEELQGLIDKAVEAKGGDRAAWLESFLEYLGVGGLLEIRAKDFGAAKAEIENAIRGAKK